VRGGRARDGKNLVRGGAVVWRCILSLLLLLLNILFFISCLFVFVFLFFLFLLFFFFFFFSFFLCPPAHLSVHVWICHFHARV